LVTGRYLAQVLPGEKLAGLRGYDVVNKRSFANAIERQKSITVNI